MEHNIPSSTKFSLACLVAAFLLVYWSTLQGLVVIWYADPNYSHGFLIPLVSGYLLWQRRSDLRAAIPRPTSWGLLVIACGLFILLLGRLSGEMFTTRFSMIPVLAGTVVFVAGPAWLRIVAFPLGYLVFMIPLPYLVYDAVAFPLKIFVSWLSVQVLQVLGIPVLREGNVISFSVTTLAVADACSGIRSIISLLAMSAALAHFAQKGWWRKVTLVVVAIPIAVVANACRVIMTGILASRYGAAVAQGFFHEFAGLAIFVVAVALLLAASFTLKRLSGDE